MLPDGARTDDDNDFEWTHLYFMDKENVLKLPYPRIVEIWKANMNKGIWKANERARALMNEGVAPPDTGKPPRNEFAWYNLSGQFCTEAYGMIAPGMPAAAEEIAVHYAHIAVAGEPIQAAQYWPALISLCALPQGTLEDKIQEATKAVDPASAMAEVVQDALKAYREKPDDWKAGRQAMYDKWSVERKWNSNATPSNGAMVILALLYGKEDFYKTLQYGMAMGLDADCNAATAGAVLGTRLGYARIAALPGFAMKDRFVNGTRPQLPRECTVSEQADMILRVAEKAILANGGEKVELGGKPGYRIVVQSPKVVESLPADYRKPETKPDGK
jgi:hypothetical protein